MHKIIRAAAATATMSLVGLAGVGVAAAQDSSYVPPACTETVGGVEVAVDCVSPATVSTGDPAGPAVESANQSSGATAVDSAGTLPYTGNDSTLPLAEAGVALLAGGGAVLLVVKRRQAAAQA